MIQLNLQTVADTVVRQARRQRFVVARDIRQALREAGVSERLWKDIVALARPTLSPRAGRYYYRPPVSDYVRQEQDHQRAIRRAVRQLIRQHRSAADGVERRQQDRIDFVQPIQLRTDDGREFHLLSRDLSPTGIRLIGSRSFLGHKVRVRVPRVGEAEPWCFVVHILWTCAVGDGLFENGGMFVGVVRQKPEKKRVKAVAAIA